MAGFDFAGKTVWVTGAGKGIGYTTALAFANAGAEVTGFDREFPGIFWCGWLPCGLSDRHRRRDHSVDHPVPKLGRAQYGSAWL